MKDVKINRYLYEVRIKEMLTTTDMSSPQEALFRERLQVLHITRARNPLLNL